MNPRIPLDPELDARLVTRCLEGDSRAWRSLVERHQRLVYGIARSYRLGDEDLGDVFQEVFAALVRSLERLRDARALVRWLSVTTDRIARATALRRRREQALRVELDPSGEGDGIDRLAADDGPVGADLESAERDALVRLALAALPDRCRRLLAALYGESPVPGYAELAERLGVPIGSLGPTRARCFEKLREQLGRIDLEGISLGPPSTSTPGKPVRTGPRARGARPEASLTTEKSR